MSTNFAKTLVWKQDYDVILWRHKQRTPNTNDYPMPLNETPPMKSFYVRHCFEDSDFWKSCTWLHNHSFIIFRSIFSAFCAMTPCSLHAYSTWACIDWLLDDTRPVNFFLSTWYVKLLFCEIDLLDLIFSQSFQYKWHISSQRVVLNAVFVCRLAMLCSLVKIQQ